MRWWCAGNAGGESGPIDIANHALAPYLSPEGRDDELARLTAACGGERRTIGTSVEGRPIWAARLPMQGAQPARPPRVLALANIHGPEYVSSAVALGLLAQSESNAALLRLRARAELWVLPCLNPDGYARVFERGGKGRLRELRPNARGVDLNRNFPLPEGRRRLPLPGAGSSRPGAATYVGPTPLSEPETVALARLCTEERFVAAVSGHSFMGRVIPAHVEDAPAYATYRALCRALAAGQPHRRYGRLASRRLDTFTGELEDYLHHHLGTWAVCLETFPLLASLRQHILAPSVFWRFNPRDPRPHVDNDVAGIAGFFHAALDQRSPQA
ncbi:MAG TPA: M14 family metallopeptidase [Polyangia bacterium]